MDYKIPQLRSSLLKFPSVTHLTLCNIRGGSNTGNESVYDKILHPSVFPSLTSINYVYLPGLYSHVSERIPDQLAQQLTHLSVYDGGYYFSKAVVPVLSEFKSLKSLVFRNTLALESLLIIPATLSSVTILKCGKSKVESLALINNWLNSVTSDINIETLLLSQDFQNVDNLDAEKAEEIINQLEVTKSTISRLGIELGYLDTSELRTIGSWELEVAEYLNKLGSMFYFSFFLSVFSQSYILLLF